MTSQHDEFLPREPWYVRYFWLLYALGLIALAAGVVRSMAHAQTACTATSATACFDASVKTGPAPLDTTLTWSVPGATACTAGGAGTGTAWNGSVPTAGSRTLSAITVDRNLTLNCTGPGKALLSWTHDGKNTDGSAVTLAGFTVLYGASASTLTQTVLVNVPSASAYTVDSLAAGSYAFAVKARSSSGAESSASNVATKTVAGITYSATVPIDVTALPSAPSGLVVTEVTAYTVEPTGIGTRVAMTLLRSECVGDQCTVLAQRQ